jgi:hypothetical protein
VNGFIPPRPVGMHLLACHQRPWPAIRYCHAVSKSHAKLAGGTRPTDRGGQTGHPHARAAPRQRRLEAWKVPTIHRCQPTDQYGTRRRRPAAGPELLRWARLRLGKQR